MSNDNDNKTIRDFEDLETREEKRQAIQKFLNIGLFPVFVFLAFMTTRFIINTNLLGLNADLDSLIMQYYPKSWDYESKTGMMFLALAHPAALIMFLTTWIMLVRVILKADALRKVFDKPVLIMLNSTVSNTLEQTFVFMSFYSFWIWRMASEHEKDQAVTYLLIFVVGRIIFILGYVLNWLTGINVIRVYGFAVTVCVQMILFSKIINKDITFVFTSY